MVRRLLCAVGIWALSILGFNLNCFAEDLTLVLVGQTQALLYPCHCPVEPDGGIARRATLLQQIRKKNPNVLLVDSGSFFAGGAMDQASLGQELDKSRTLVHLKAMELMQYDAASLSPDEFVFGRQFLEENISKTKIAFLGANLVSDKILPYRVKKFPGFQVGVIGLVNPLAGAKAPGLNFIPPQDALKKAVADLKNLKVNAIILISGLKEEENKALVAANPEIDVLIEGAKFAKEKVSTNIGAVLVLAPRWEGRRLVTAKLSLKNKGKGVEVKKVEDPRLSDKLASDKQMLAILPQCFGEKDCNKEGMISSCSNPGQSSARCAYKPAPRVELTVINKPDCRTCNTESVINSLKSEIPGLSVNALDFPGEKAQKVISEFGLKYLPVYFLDKSAEKERVFAKLKPDLELKGEYYFLNAQISGLGYFLNRKKIDGRLDLFLNLLHKDSGELLDNLKEFEPEVHFLAAVDKNGFAAPGGRSEIEEYLRAVCVQKYYPGLFYNYISCRAKNFDSSWWDECLQDADLGPVKSCALGAEGSDLLKANIALNRELEIANGPTYLLDNQEIFGSVKVPKKEEFRKILMTR